jgi:uncharacterized protein
METVIRVRVTPRAGRDLIAGWQDGVLRVRLAAAPVDGKANAALIRLLARALGLPARDLRLAGGETAREKRVVVTGLDVVTITTRLSVPNA